MVNKGPFRHTPIPSVFFLAMLLSGSSFAQEQVSTSSYERPQRSQNSININGETDRFGPLEDPPPSTLSSQPPRFR